MTHMSKLMLENGPLIHFRSMSFERKNKNVKEGARSSNSKNLPFTLGTRNQLNLCYKWPNPSQIRQSAYAYFTYHVEIKIFMFYSKKYFTRVFLFFCFMRSAMPTNSEKILSWRKNMFNVIFKLLLFHQFFKLLNV